MATLRLPAVFSDHMVLQRDLPLPVWGWAKPGETVSVRLADQLVSGVADAKGRWCVTLSPLALGAPVEMAIAAGGSTTTIRDILIGDVWLCSGQSNMEWTLQNCDNAESALADADQPQIRLLKITKNSAPAPADDIQSGWDVCKPETVASFSGVAYFFGRHLQREIGVPIGLINSSWGGTTAEAWTPLGDLRSDADFQRIIERLEAFKPVAAPEPHQDPGNKGFDLGWAAPDLDDSDWETMDIPRSWESHGLDMDGSVWFRRTVDLPADWAGKPLTLNLGVADDFDTTYFNGQEIGTTGKSTPNWWTTHRRYEIDGSLVKAGKNTIGVRVFDQWAQGGLLGPELTMNLHSSGDPANKIPLGGYWKYKIELALPSRSAGGTAVQATSLYNGMIHPLIPFALRGATWYQGESNADRGFQYRKLLPAMIRSWRREWGQGDFPFVVVQLANYQNPADSRQGSPWAELREAQAMVLQQANTGLAVTIDIGQADDIHPRNKKDVGIRLAYEALRVGYGRSVPRSPMFASAAFSGGKAVLKFDHADDGLVARDGGPVGFVIAGDDLVFHPAKAVIDGATVILTSEQVLNPTAARYAWSSNPTCNLYNRAGLPMCPFRTDNARGVTAALQ